MCRHISNQVFPTSNILRDLIAGAKKMQETVFETKLPLGNFTRHEKLKQIIEAVYKEKNNLTKETVNVLQNEFIALNLQKK